MADKYVDVSLTTGANDGTSPANAWRSFLDVFTNTMGAGSVAAGDIIHVRTADGSGDLSESMTAAKACALPAGCVIRFDSGVKWAQAGVFTLDQGAGLYTLTFSGVPIEAGGSARRLRVYSSRTGNLTGLVNNPTTETPNVDGLLLDAPNCPHYMTMQNAVGRYSNVKIRAASMYNNASYGFVGIASWSCVTFISLEIEITGTVTGGELHVCKPGNYGGSAVFIGGRLYGDNVSWDTVGALCGNQAAYNVIFDGFKVPEGFREMRLAPAGSVVNSVSLVVRGANHHLDCYVAANNFAGACDFKFEKNYPTLNAVLPDSGNTPWSWRVSPLYTSPSRFHQLPLMQKQYDQVAATKTVTVELLVNQLLHAGDIALTGITGTFDVGDTVTGATSGATATVVSVLGGTTLSLKSVNGAFQAGEVVSNGVGASGTASNNLVGLDAGSVRMFVAYVDASTGETVVVSSLEAGAALQASSAAWSSTTYGAKTYDRRKLSITTPTNIKQHSLITVTVEHNIEGVNADDFFFVDPDFTVS